MYRLHASVYRFVPIARAACRASLAEGGRRSSGVGTPSPVAPTESLVVGGLYRYVRNPMYLAVGATILGQALVLGRVVLLPYAAAFALAVALFVRRYEEPTLRRRFGSDYERYTRAVPRWWPRRTAWDDGGHVDR